MIVNFLISIKYNNLTIFSDKVNQKHIKTQFYIPHYFQQFSLVNLNVL